MEELARVNNATGVKTSKSAYVATAVKVQLIKEGCVIVEDEPKEPRRKNKKNRGSVAPVANVADFKLDGEDEEIRPESVADHTST
jgi:hypothetical protein